MADIYDIKTRRNLMSKIRSRNTKPEMLVRKYLHSNGFRYRLHQNNLAGNPDIVLSKYNAVIFINGCFWHGHNECKKFSLPKTRTTWWANKIEGNINRDRIVDNKIRELGWNVYTIWECELSKMKRQDTLTTLKTHIERSIDQLKND